MRRIIPLALLVLTLSSACSGGHDHSSGDGGDQTSVDDGGVVPGSPASAGDSSRKISVVASDDFKFDPASINVEAGEVVTFVVRNEGEAEHEFVLGDEAYQEQHEMDMSAGDHHMSEMENALTVAAGETVELTWRFDEAGTVLYGCHEPGHYEGGMVGAIEIG
jgi:uncharacterized cupredoxin-like copper-binding protein